jgi:curli biogenesis system outer membrane secretion channel CsgG
LSTPALKQQSKQRLVKIAIPALLLTVVIALAISYWPVRSSSVEVTLPQVPGKKPLAVMYFENQSDNQELNWMREGLADMLITNLSRSARLTVLGRQQSGLMMLLRSGAGARQKPSCWVALPGSEKSFASV